jgi:nucleotide-binding universal stress UspA family protein
MLNGRMKILIAHDGSECADTALEDLLRAGLPGDAEALVLSAVDVYLPPPQGTETLEDTFPFQVPAGVKRARAHAARALEDAKSLAARAGERVRANFPGWEVRSEADADSPAWAIIKKAEEWRPDLVVVGSHGRTSLGRFVLGSVSQKVLVEARSSVRIAWRAPGRVEEDTSSPLRLIIGIDDSPGAEKAVEAVAGRTWPAGTSVRLVTAFEPFYLHGVEPATQELLTDSVQRTAAHTLGGMGLSVSSITEEGDPKRVLVEAAEAWGADAIFLGAKGHRLLERTLLGSVSYAVAARAACTVEVVRSPEM